MCVCVCVRCSCVLKFKRVRKKKVFKRGWGEMRAREERPSSNYETKDKKKKGRMERRGPEVEERMHSSDVLAGWVLGSGGGGCEPGIILVSHCLLFSNQLLSSAAP